MADLKGTYRSPNGSPYFDYEITYSETGRTGSSAKYKVNLRIRMTSTQSRYGYGIRAYVKINGTKVEKQIKNASPMWSGNAWQGTWSFDVTASAGTGGGTLSAEVKLWGTDGGAAPNMTISGKTVNLSTWNTAPSWTSDDGNINGWKEHRYIPENTGEVTVNIPTATDKEGNRIYFDAYRYVNGVSTAKVLSGGSGGSFKDNLSSVGQGSAIKYLYKCHDGSLWAGDRWSWTYTKNTLTPANVTIPNSITFSSASLQVNLSGHSNKDGNNSFTFAISSPNFPIYNADSVSGSTEIKIYKSGTVPSTPYVKFEEIKNFVRGNSWQGTATINVETKNAYGSRASKSAVVSIDLRVSPTTVSTINVTGQITVAGGSYYIPSRGAIGVNWSSASDQLGGAIRYDLQGGYSDGSWTTLKSDLTGTSTSVNLETVTRARAYRFRVVAKTTFGYSSTSSNKEVTLHYYNAPKISLRNVTRSASQYAADVITETDTSITAVAITTRQWQDKNNNFNNFAGSPYRLTQNGLGETDAYTRQIRCSDNSGLSEGSTTLSYQVSSYVPIVSIRKKGLGINTLADDRHKFKVNGWGWATAFTSRGYQTIATAGSHAGKWSKIAAFTITTQYHDVSAIIHFLDEGSGSGYPLTGTLRVRVKQQDVMGNAPACSGYLENNKSCAVSDFKLVVVENTSVRTKVELWFKNPVTYTSTYFTPVQKTGSGTLDMFELQSFQTGLPAGQQINFALMNTLAGLGGMGAVNKNGYWGLTTPEGADNTWIRTTTSGIIPYQSGGYSSLGTSGWPFNSVYSNTLYEGGKRLDEKYLQKTGGMITGELQIRTKYIEIGNDTSRLMHVGVGPTDVYVNNVKSGKYLALKDTGDLLYDGKKVLRDIQSTPLWQGSHHMSAKETVTPSKPLSECNNGWVLVWSDWDSGSQGQNWNFCFTHVPKNNPWKDGKNHSFPLSAGEGDGSYSSKTLYIRDNNFSGHDSNRQGRADDIVIRAVLEY